MGRRVLLLAPWPHDYLHRLTFINGVFNWPPLVGIEYVSTSGSRPSACSSGRT